MTELRSYERMLSFETFEDRFEYLSLKSRVGDVTFGFERFLNQEFYRSREWRKVRDEIIIRDNGCDLGIADRYIFDPPIIHHIIPMRPEDFEDGNPLILDPNNLITVSHDTHNAIHFGNASLLRTPWQERRPGDDFALSKPREI